MIAKPLQPRMTARIGRRCAAWCLVAALFLSVPAAGGRRAVAQENERDRGPQPVGAAEGSGGDRPQGDQAESETIIENPMAVLEALRPYFVAGFVLAFILCSVIAVWFAIERLVVLRRGRVIPKPFVERFVHLLRKGELERNDALKLCDENGSPIAAIFAHGVRKWGKPSVEVEQAIIDGGERQVSQLRKHLRVLGGVSTVSPLIGLLGTVLGMILSFNQIAQSEAMGNAQQLAYGISMALLTTAAGLMIAIPTLITYTYLSGRVDSLVMEMDLRAQDVVQLISAEAFSNQPLPTMHARRKSSSPAGATSGSKAKRAV